ncbi:MAG: SDR family oxidoreductase [Myxococcales bacterium]|nr:SDR family oxidoreductase [Myxococcales bacterium]
MPFTEHDLPDLRGQTALVTGANSGIGLEAARMLAARGAEVLLACRTPSKGETAIASIRRAAPDAKVRLERLDLASLASVRQLAERLRRELTRLDLLVNNAGVMALPKQLTEDGFEMQLGTNHLGHFALTGLLLPLVLAAPAGRVVSVSSLAHRFGRMKLHDLHYERGYQKWLAYGQSKLANLLFTFELQRRFEAAEARAIAVACHPGFASTNLQFVGPRLEGSRLMEALMRLNNRFLAQSAAEGALPTVYAATSATVRGGDFVGPSGLFEIRGAPARARVAKHARDVATAKELWALSERATGVRYDLAAAADAVARA